VSSARRGAWALSWLVLGGCAVDLWVGDPAGTGGSEATTAASDDTTTTPPSTETGTTTSGPEPGTTEAGTTEAGTTVALDEGTSSTGPTVEEGTTSDPDAEGGSTTAAEIPCPGLGMLDCNELGYCLWYGTPKKGECAPNPCENPLHDCWSLGFEECEAAFACAWVGEAELGECGPIECVPCEVLGLDQCTKTPTCTWNEGEMFCLPA
jgi:hypothetical protein